MSRYWFSFVLLTGLCCFTFADIEIQSSYPETVSHLTGSLAYPQNVLQMNRVDGWFFGGAIGGNWGGVKLVEAPERPGQQALEFSFSANRASPQWLMWVYSLDPQLSVFGAREIVFDLYPVDELTMDISAYFGSQQGQTILPICWHSLGKHPAGKWVTVKLPIMTQRYIDNLKFSMDNQAEGIFDGKVVRFILANIRFEPAPQEIAQVPLAALKTRSSIQAGYLELPQGKMLKDAQPLQLHLELSPTSSQTATLQVMKWRQKVELKAPFTVLDITIPGAVDALGSGRFPVNVELTDVDGQRLAWLATPITLATFNTTTMNQQRQKLIQLLNRLQAKADQISGNEEIRVSLTVARLFLEKYIPDDFNRQGALEIAMNELADVHNILLHAQKALVIAKPAPPLTDYNPLKPVVIKNGNFTQDGHPIFFVGPLGWPGMDDAIELAPSLGFNSFVMDVGLANWYDSNGDGEASARQALELGKRAGIAMSFQLASHYVPALNPADAAAIGDGAAGNPGLPWNIVRPETRQVLGAWYDKMLPFFSAYPNLLNIGTANEPTYNVNSSSQSFQIAFQQWLPRQYPNITAVNTCWGSAYASFETIDLPSFFKLQEVSKGAYYDWNQFLAQTMGDFFAFLNHRIHQHLPNASVSVKLSGGYGYDYLDEQAILYQGGQTVHGTDGNSPMYYDYLKSLDPTLPAFNGEWHILGSMQEGHKAAYLSRMMFEGVAHGLGAGDIWQWMRFDWNTSVNGAEGAITRYPIGLDAMGRTAIRLRRYMPIISRFANLNGGQIRLLYSKVSHLHQSESEERLLPGVNLLVKVPAYQQGLESIYRNLSGNAAGVRFVIPETLDAGKLANVSLLAAGAGDYIQTPALAVIESWVAKGGTLWLTAPCMQFDPWGKPHQGIVPEFLTLLATAGEHPYKHGRIVVDENWTGFQQYFEGPQVRTTTGEAVTSVECRVATSQDGKKRYLYLCNSSEQAQTVVVMPTQKWIGHDLWNGGEINLAKPVRINANGVIIIEVPLK